MLLHKLNKKEKRMYKLFSVKKFISTSKRHAEHPFAGQNTQQSGIVFLS